MAKPPRPSNSSPSQAGAPYLRGPVQLFPNDLELASLHGIGPKRAAALRNRGLVSFSDVLFHLPYRYIDLRRRQKIADLHSGDEAVVAGTLGAVVQRPMRGNRWRRLTSATFTGLEGGRIRLVWFNLPSYARLPAGGRVLVHGRIATGIDGTLEIAHPEIHRLDEGEPPPFRPVYRLPPEVGQTLYTAIVTQVLKRTADAELNAIPAEMREASVGDAMRYLHNPPADADIDELESGSTWAHRVLALDELFAFELALLRERTRAQERRGAAFDKISSITSDFISALPFRPTAAQTAAIAEIAADLRKPMQMNRLLLGDVGSGKTLVALWAALRAAESGYQAAMMAPTELLAEQHHATFQRLCGRTGVQGALLTGRVTGAERGRLLRLIGNGGVEVIFGTQALIQERVHMHRLGLAIIDEQHRFGVFDRARLLALGTGVNVLLMTATPIPRSLAMLLFRNLDVSILDELPPGRTPIRTTIHSESSMHDVEKLVHDELSHGNRAYFVAPAIDADDDITSVESVAKRLKHGPLGRFRIGVLHGRMRPAEKDRVMRDFRDGALDLMVATTVVEVGLDVPEATVVVVLAAERYGLAQLHQLRGRVGRGSAPSYCCLALSQGADERARTRLDVLVRSAKGAEVAEADLRLRGPGDLFGTRQTGALPLRFGHLIHDFDLISRAGEMAEKWIRRDPQLKLPDSQPARLAVERMMSLGFSLGDVG
jgi:ATP-dependent DNA helicase RecG